MVALGSLGHIWETGGNKKRGSSRFLPSVSLLCLSWLAFSFLFLHVAEKIFINSLGSIIPRILSPQAKRKN